MDVKTVEEVVRIQETKTWDTTGVVLSYRKRGINVRQNAATIY